MKFRKKPVVIEAEQWTGRNCTSMQGFLGPVFESARYRVDLEALILPTLEGDMTASKGDWIIKGVKGEFYTCKPDIFAATYEAVE